MIRGILLGAWRLIPPAFRLQLLSAYAWIAMPRIAPPATIRPGIITVVGPVRATTGVGEGARLCYQALRDSRIPAAVLDFTAPFRAPDHAFDVEAASVPASPGGALIVHLNPPHFDVALAAMGRPVVEGRMIIGYWAWELPVVPDLWLGSLRRLHEVWVPSAFVAEAIRAARPTSTPPIRVVPHPVPVPLCAPLPRAHFELPDDAFVVFMAFHMGAGFARKNPLAALRAFMRAFADTPSAVLVMSIKEPGDDAASYRRLLDEIGGTPNVRILHDKLSRAEMNALLACSDVLLSLHRSEGFGLSLAEGMLLGKPVVATGWSGNLEFMTRSNACLVDSVRVPVQDPTGPYRGSRQSWAEPDVEQAASFLRRLYEDRSFRRELGARAHSDATTFFALERFRERIEPSLGSVIDARSVPPG